MMDSIPISDEARVMIDAARAALSKGTSKRTRHPGERGKVNAARWAMLNRFVDVHMRRLPSSAALVWFALFRHADGKGVVSRALSMLEKDTALSRKTVRKSITALESAGLLSVSIKGNNVDGRYTTSCYRLRKMDK